MTTLVIGGTGTVGSATVLELLRRGAPVRVLTRDAARAGALLGDDVDVVEGAIEDPAVRGAAFAGTVRLVLAMGNHPGQVALECSAIDAARAAGVQRIVKVSAPAPAHDSPLFIERWHAQIEDRLAASGLPASVLRPATFMTNLLAFAEPVARDGVLPAPAAGARVAFVDPRDVGTVAAALAVSETPPTTRVLRVTGPAAVGYADVATALAAAVGRPVTFVPVADDDARAAMRAAGLPDLMVEAFLAVYRMQRAGAFAEVSRTVAAVLGRPARSVADFVSDHRLTFASAASPAPAR